MTSKLLKKASLIMVFILVFSIFMPSAIIGAAVKADPIIDGYVIEPGNRIEIPSDAETIMPEVYSNSILEFSISAKDDDTRSAKLTWNVLNESEEYIDVVSISEPTLTSDHSTVVVSYDPGAVVGDSFIIEVSDGKLTDRLKVDVTVMETIPVDTTPPVITVNMAGGEEFGDDETFNLVYTATDDSQLSSVTATLDDTETNIPSGTDLVFSEMELGAHTLYVSAEDAAENTSSNEISFTVVETVPVDTTPPVITVNMAGGEEFEDDETFNLIYSAADDIQIASVSAILDNTGTNIPSSTDLVFGEMEPGEHTLVITALDTSKNQSTKEIMFTVVETIPVDTTPPVITVNMVGGEEFGDDETFKLVYTATDDNQLSSVTATLDDTETNIPSGTDLVFSEMELGAHTLYVSAEDAAENTSSNEISFTVIEEVVSREINYVSLGDSIATGTIYDVGWLSNTITSYPSYFAAKLKENNQGATVNWDDFSEDGDQSGDLLAKLESAITSHEAGIDTEFYIALINAEVITISIGGNNLMQATKDADGSYDFSTINTDLADSGRDQFATDWPQIITALKSINDTATIIVNTLYNPYNIDDPLYSTVIEYYYNEQKTGINDVINEYDGYEIADVYSAFKKYTDVNESIQITYLYGEGWWENLTRNPHPRALGQQIITELNYAAYDPSYVPVEYMP